MSKFLFFETGKKNQFKELTDKIAAQETEIASATAFIKEIEKGNLETTNADGVDLGSLTGSLVSMRNKMKSIAEEEKERNWITEGLAKFSDILRSDNDDLKKLSNIIISELVKYMNANQGGLYLINNPKSADEHIELVAAYAYGRQKYIKQKIEMGEGLLGQAALEKETIYLKEVPNDYMRITSGLGDALPRNLIIVPLKLEEEVYGLVELASFKEIKKHQVQFVEKLSETLAATIAAVKNTERTQTLLKESQLQTEQLRAQEEEVRQNMEELAATQEEMQRILIEVQNNEKEVSGLLNASTDSIMIIDRDYRLLRFNDILTKGFPDIRFEKGFDIFKMFVTDEERNNKRKLYDQAFAGRTVESLDHIHVGEYDLYFRVTHSPIYDAKGNISSIAVYASNVTELHKSKERAEKLAQDAQNTAEELKAQEEEIRQNMEELSATQEEMQRILSEVQKNEAEINEILNASSDSIVISDRNYRTLRFNATYAKAFPHLKIEKGFDIMSMFPTEEIRKAKRKIYDEAFTGKTVESIDNVQAGGMELYFRVIHTPLFDEHKNVTSIAIYASNITALHLAKQQAEQNEKAVNELINVSGDSIMVLDHEYRLIRWNKIFDNLLAGIELKKGFDLMTIFTPEEQKIKKQTFDRVFAGEIVELTETIEVMGRPMSNKVKHSPIYDVDGKINAIAIYVTNITDIVESKNKAEKLAVEAQNQAEELKAQEEEIRQNMEELSATQEEMQRILSEVQKNEADVRSLLNISSDVIYTLDRNYKIDRFNDTFSKSYGSLKIEKGFDILQAYDNKDDKQKRKQSFERSFNGETLNTETHVVVEGNEHYLAIKQAPIRDAEGNITSIAIFASDVTALTKAKKSLEEREDVFGHTTILSEADLKGTITYANKKLCEVSKYSEKELIGKGHNIFRHADMPKELFKLFWQTIQKGEVFKGIIKNKAKDGSHYWVDATIVPVKDGNGKVVKYIGVRHHITDDDVAIVLYNKQAKKLKLPELK